MSSEKNPRVVRVVRDKDLSNWCRICMTKKKPLWPLFKYKLSGNFAEMLTAIADVKVAADDGLPDKICSKCCSNLEKAFILKTMAERSDKKFRMLLPKLNKGPTKKLAFDSITDIKSEINSLNIKNEPKWDYEIEVLSVDNTNLLDPSDTEKAKDIVIANTVIRKVDGNPEDTKPKNDFFKDDPDVTWNKSDITNEDSEVEFLDDNFFQDDGDDFDDTDYEPPKKLKAKNKFKEPKLSEIKVFKDKPVVKRVKVLNKLDKNKSSLITCYTVNKNGSRGPPIILKRPKDANNIKYLTNFKTKTVKVRPVKAVKKEPKVEKTKEKMVCPVCGILTFTLGNHMATHQEKKKFTCTECPKTFAQKSNLLTHMKYHTGVKDHICEVCGAGFYCQKGLIRHNLIHTGERPFACSLCPKRFIARCDLNRHLRIHSGYKPFKCNMCTMSFNAKHQLQNHERMHTGERPYSCQVCNVSFSYKVNLNNHVAKMHGINLKFKSIHTVTEDVLRKEMECATEARTAIAHILPQNVPQPAAHETVHHTTDYSI